MREGEALFIATAASNCNCCPTVTSPALLAAGSMRHSSHNRTLTAAGATTRSSTSPVSQMAFIILIMTSCCHSHPHSLSTSSSAIASMSVTHRLPVDFDNHHQTDEPAFRVFYGSGQNGEEDLPICSPHSVCNKVDTYDSPWVERQCRCPGEQHCSMSLESSDGYTVTDKTRQFKTCEPVKKLPKCRYFRDVTWTFINYPDNSTQQVMHCLCPKNSVAYIIKRQAYESEQGLGYQYSFACSPQSRLRCQRKEPCRLFTAKKRSEVEEVNTNSLCQCPHGHKCPRRHTDVGVVPGKVYTEDLIRIYSAYCI